MHTQKHSGASARAQITLASASVSRGGNRILNKIDLSISAQSRVGIVGENGRGKTTLLQLLAGRFEPDSGSVTRIGSIGVADQEMPTHDERTVEDAVTEAIAESTAALEQLDAAAAGLGSGDDPHAETRYAEALEHVEALEAWGAERRVTLALRELDADFDRDHRLDTLSVGQRYRVRLACLLGGDHDLLLLDEPTNHLDRSGLDFLTVSLRARRGGVALVSHDRALLADVANIIVDLDPTFDGKARVYGGYDAYREGRAAEVARWEQTYEREQAERAQLHDDLVAAQSRLSTGWRPDKGTGKHQRQSRAAGITQSVHRRREALEAHAVTVPEPPLRFNFPELKARSGSVLIEAEGVVLHGRLAPVPAVEVQGGSKLLITGPNGAGKSTLLRLLAGELEPDAGRVTRSTTARITLLSQESDLPLRRTAADVFRSAAQGDDTVSLTSLGLLRSADTSKRVGELSIGQQRRLDLAITLASKPQVLLLDEPTNHLSIGLVDELTEALCAMPAAVVVTSHDRQLLRDLTNWSRIELADPHH
ncbi:ABC-F family ATP-binding cassette domain-containing protein [Leucobacter denitrificans]|uniref:ABC-F family ATP-binding cassette domain-containing protein n=1 Tax=Leucobacter denitrificans TaxID=683042 RepID=A0A7G9S2M7_9MICO|nr:ABC-F family ATP-binding cassette domain-containing protein [Leucobacter denitrificans]QNN62102.1 ABC-F family ATP-binding cassette domain-containing protein [Leucobacter denitrificans]